MPRRSVVFCFALLILPLAAGCLSSSKPVTTAPIPATVVPDTGVALNEDFSGRQVFTADNPWNADVSNAPVDANSQAWIDWLSRRTEGIIHNTVHLYAEFGPPPEGIPYVGVSGAQRLVPVTFVDYPEESDSGAPGRPPGYPIPTQARTDPHYIQGDVTGGGTVGDRHMIVVDRDHWLAFETWETRWNASAGRWEAGSGAVWDLSQNVTRREGWTSADGAGMAIFPGLVRYDEVFGSGEISHAFRFTTHATNGHVWPATHSCSATPGAPPVGLRLRLKASVVLDGYPPEVQKIYRALKTHGLILADIGGDMFVSGTMDPRWAGSATKAGFWSLSADSFEVVQAGWGAPGTTPR